MLTDFLPPGPRGRTHLLLALWLCAASALLPLEAHGQGFLEDLGTEGACDSGDLAACEREGDEKSDSYRASSYKPERALKVYQRACKGGRLEACAKLGTLYYSGKGTPQDYRRAASLYQQACNGGRMPACTWLGGLYRFGQGVKADPKKARALWQKACAGKDWQGCGSLGQAHELGIGGAVDLGAAVSAWEQGCALDDYHSCELAGTHYLDGKGVEKDLDKAKHLLRRACDLGAGLICITACKLQPEVGNCRAFLRE